MTLKSQAPATPAGSLGTSTGASSGPEKTETIKEVILGVLQQKKLMLQARVNQQLSFVVFRDKLIYMFVTLFTLLTVVLFISYPSDLFPRWYVAGVVIMYLARVMDYTQKKEHFFLLDCCYTAGGQILYFLLCSSGSVSLGIRAFAFGAGLLQWSTILLVNGLTFHRLDEFCSLWIHTVPSLLAYTLRWTNVNSPIYYATLPRAFSGSQFLQYFNSVALPYVLWAVGYYLLINKIFKNLTIEGDYMTLVKLFLQRMPSLAPILDVFGSKYRVEAFMMYHVVYFTLVTSIGYVCFFFHTLHAVCLGLCCFSAVAMGGVTLVKDLARPCQQSVERVDKLIASLA